MSCYNPLSAWYGKDVNPETGKRPIVFHPSQAFTDLPVELPCGKCEGCRADQSLMWSIRAYHESQEHERNCFVTLTYDDSNYPADGCINKRDLQLFFKRLRKEIAPVKCRYIACGEYGDTTGRAHYHALLFGVDFRDYRRVMLGSTMYTHPVLEKCWGKGQVAVDSMSMASICYTCGYVFKKIGATDTFNLMSRRPGIGKNWLEKYLGDLQRIGKVVIEGREYAIPDRYMRWNEDDLKEVKAARVRYAKENAKRHDPVERRKRSEAQRTNRRARINDRNEKL